MRPTKSLAVNRGRRIALDATVAKSVDFQRYFGRPKILSDGKLAPRAGLEPATIRLTVICPPMTEADNSGNAIRADPSVLLANCHFVR